MAIPINVKIAEAAAKVLGRRLDLVPAKAVLATQNANHRELVGSSRKMPAGRVPLDREIFSVLSQKGLRKSDETLHIPTTFGGQ
jgi:hypothetical protein